MNLIAQEHSMGCAVACVAARCGMTYASALSLFPVQNYAWTRGFYCSEIVKALEYRGHFYSYAKFKEAEHGAFLSKLGTIIFIEPYDIYPHGHFFVLGPGGWMNPWSNYPSLLNVQAQFQKSLPGKIQYIVYES